MLSIPFRALLALWFALEFLVFAAAIHFIGLGWTLLAALATSVIGILLLKRTGTTALLELRTAMRGAGGERSIDVLRSTLLGLAAMALILPGFVSDGLGLLLMLPPFRRGVGGWLRRRLRPAGGASSRGAPVVDLDRTQWTRAETSPDGEIRSMSKRLD